MSISLEIHAEKFENSCWNAVSTRIEDVSYDAHIIASWLESEPLFCDSDRNLSRILGAVCYLSEDVKPRQRGWPQNASNEVLRAFSMKVLSTWPEDNNRFRAEVLNQAIRFSPSWLLLSELMKFDWNSPMILCNGKVDARYAPLFGDGQQLFPAECPIEGLIQFKPEKDCRPFWSFRKKQMIPSEYAFVSWIEPYSDDDYDKRIKPSVESILSKLQPFGDAKNVRIIYWTTA